MIRRIVVIPRWRLPELDMDERYAVISVTDPRPFGEQARIPKRWGLEDVCRLEFFDFDPASKECDTHPRAMQDEHGGVIREFVAKVVEKVGALVVHCEAGASRSPSIAMAICDHLRLPRQSILWTSPDGAVEGSAPNQHVYHTTIKALNERAK